MARRIAPVFGVTAALAVAVVLVLGAVDVAPHHRSARRGGTAASPALFALVRRVNAKKLSVPQDCSVSSTPCVRGCTLPVADTMHRLRGQTSPCASPAARTAPCLEPVVAGAAYCSGGAEPLFERDKRGPSRRRP